MPSTTSPVPNPITASKEDMPNHLLLSPRSPGHSHAEPTLSDLYHSFVALFTAYCCGFFTPEYSPMYVVRDIVPRFTAWISTFANRFLDFSPPVPTYQNDGELPTIENVPPFERLVFWINRGPVYLANMVQGFIVGTYLALYDYKAEATPDHQLCYFFSYTVYSKFLHRVQSVPFLASRSIPVTPPKGYWYYVADFSFVPNVKTFPGFYTSASIGVFRVPQTTHDSVMPEPVAIQLTHDNDGKIEKNVFVPGDNAWDGAKMFLMQGANHMGALCEHPKIHFPYDTVNAYTYHLAPSSKLKKLLTPHCQFTLTLDDTVLNSQYISIVANPLLTQTPFDAPGSQLRKYLQEMKRDFGFPEEAIPEENVFPYGSFLRSYYSVFHGFVEQVVLAHESEFKDVSIVKWADKIANILPGFPKGSELTTTSLIDILSFLMWNLSVNHGTDHFTFYNMRWNQNVWRSRVRPPSNPKVTFDFKRAHKQIDMWKWAQCQIVFLYTGAATKLQNIDYGFNEPALQHLNSEFRDALRNLDLSFDKKMRVIPLWRLGDSIDY